MSRNHVALFGVPYNEKPRRRRRSSDVPSEAAEQRMVVQWLAARRLLYCHVPNGEKRDIITASRLRGLGVRRGCPDLLVFTPPPGKFGITGVAIEMKRRGATASGVSVEQREWLAALEACGWRTCVAFGADDAIAWLESLYGKA